MDNTWENNMNMFTLVVDQGPSQAYMRQEAEGTDIADAIRSSNLLPGEYMHVVAYEQDGKAIDIASQSNCGCVYHAEDGLSCRHDLKLIGL